VAVCACHPSYTGGIGRKITVKGQPLAKKKKKKARLYRKNNESIKGWRCGSNGGALA
jgi:hypothetical protein